MADPAKTKPPAQEPPIADDKKSGDKGKGSTASAAAPATKASSGQKVRFGKTHEIDMGKELPQYSNTHVKAYATKDIKGEEGDYFAMICEPNLTPRARRSSAYERINGGPQAFIIDSGVVRIPKIGERFCFIYKDNLGKPIFDKNVDLALGWKAERVLEKIVTPVIMCLKDLHEVDMAHGNIRPTNFYDGGKETYESIMLGECLSTPASFLQPALYESLQRCTADAIGRGEGLIQDDLYALGVCIAMFMRTKNPLAGKSEEDIVAHKISQGTYSTIIDKDDRFTGAVLELLRGLLIDDPRHRWSMEDVLAWLDGRRLSPKQTAKRKRGSRPLSFRNKNYLYLEAIANDLFKKPAEAVQMIESNDLEQWILRSVEDKAANERLESALLSAEELGKGNGYWDRLLSRVSVALDPEGPIRYKDVSVGPEGFGFALADAYAQETSVQPYVDIFNGSLLNFWLVTCTELNIDVSVFVSRFEKCKEYVKRPMMGYGVERCLYFLNNDAHCLSPILKNYWVRDPEDFLNALEDIAGSNSKPRLAFDRHIAAFLSVKEAKVIDSFLYDLNSNEPFRKLIGVINICAAIQRVYSMPPMPNLTKWISGSLNILIDRYHDKYKREDLVKKLQKLESKGDIGRLVKLVDDSETVNRDLASFKLAMHEYDLLTKEYKFLETSLESSKSFGKVRGRQFSVIISGIVASLIIVGFIVMQYGGDSPLFQ